MRKYFDVLIPHPLLKPIQDGHPWGFSRKFQNFLKDCPPQHFVRLRDPRNHFIANAFYTPNELAILKIFWYKENFNLDEFYKFLEDTIKKRMALFQVTNSIRLLHGENDSLPSITVDLHNTTLIVRVYSPFLIYFGRYVQVLIRKILKLNYGIQIESAIFQLPNRSLGSSKIQNPIRVWYGTLPKRIWIQQEGIGYFINPQDQKGGIYNDIRNLRSFILQNSDLFPKTRALNLFANNGFLSKILEHVGVEQVFSLEDSQKSIAVAKENLDPRVHTIIKLNIFKELEKFLTNSKMDFDTIIIDPPSLTASNRDKPKARKIYSELIRIVLPYLNPNGILVLCSCSNRIHEPDFERIAKEEFKRNNIQMKLIAKLPPEIDHPTRDEFPEGKYFKVHIYKRIDV